MILARVAMGVNSKSAAVKTADDDEEMTPVTLPTQKPLILASTSVYRRAQLEQLQVPFTTASPEVDEAPLKSQGLAHHDLSQRLALMKAHAVSQQHPDAIVMGGDQVASFGNRVLSKPITPEKAAQQLQALSGQTHRLITSLAIVSGEQEHVHTCTATLTMRDLSEEQIVRYIERDEPLHCCGSYRLEALGISLFESIECDDHTSIIGVPLMWTAKTLSALGVPIP